MRSLLGLLVALALVPGCYESRLRGDPEPESCAAAGVHRVTQTLTFVSPGCGMVGPVGELDVSLPPTEELFLGATSVEIVPLGVCTWSVHAETLIPDASSTVDGTIDGSDGTVRATFDVEFSGFTGEVCRSTIEWRER